jgi:RNA polymerase-binding transcription factor
MLKFGLTRKADARATVKQNARLEIYRKLLVERRQELVQRLHQRHVEIAIESERLDSGQYGVCEGCDSRIPGARLRALPWTGLCIECEAGGIRQHYPSEPVTRTGKSR